MKRKEQIEIVIRCCADHFGVDPERPATQSKKREIIRFKEAAALMLQDYLNLSHGEIAKILKAHRTTVRHHITKLRKLIPIYAEYTHDIQEILLATEDAMGIHRKPTIGALFNIVQNMLPGGKGAILFCQINQLLIKHNVEFIGEMKDGSKSNQQS